MPPENRRGWSSGGHEGKRRDVGVMPKPLTEDPGPPSVITKVLKSGSAHVQEWPHETDKVLKILGSVAQSGGPETSDLGLGQRGSGQAGRGSGPGHMTLLCQALPERGRVHPLTHLDLTVLICKRKRLN